MAQTNIRKYRKGAGIHIPWQLVVVVVNGKDNNEKNK
jgi:hypothetical protein